MPLSRTFTAITISCRKSASSSAASVVGPGLFSGIALSSEMGTDRERESLAFILRAVVLGALCRPASGVLGRGDPPCAEEMRLETERAPDEERFEI